MTPSVNAPSFPLAPEVRAAYQDLYDKMQSAIDSTMDATTVEALNPGLNQIDEVLTKDDIYKLAQNTENLKGLKKQIQAANEDLMKLRDQVESIASHISLAGDIIAGIEKILTLVPAL